MSKIDLDALEQAALKATPGPWEVVHRDDDHSMTMTVIAPKGSMGNSSNVMRLSDDPNQANVIAITWHQLTPWAGQEAFNNDQSDANDSFIAAANPAVILELIRRLREAERVADLYRVGLDAVVTLIDSSEGVAGLHRNGDIAPWDELRAGGRFEGWLIAFDEAVEAMSQEANK
jgi:hypothetical protein